MIPFMDYIVREFATATDWNYDNSYSFLTATSDALLSFQTPSTIALHVSSLSTANFATSYTLSTLGQLDGSISYLYTNTALNRIDSQSPSIPLKKLTYGYRDVPLPVNLSCDEKELPHFDGGRKPIVLHATLALPPPSTLTGLYARRVSPETLVSVYLNSRSVVNQTTSGPPAASVLAHVQRDTGRYSVEGLGSTDNALLGLRGLWNFGIGSPEPYPDESESISSLEGSPDIPLAPEAVDDLSPYHARLSRKPSLLSAGAEFYYSPFSHVIGMSTGLRFTTLATHIAPTDVENSKISKPLAGTSAAFSSALLAPSHISQSSFPYTMTLTMNPIIGSLASTYSVKPTKNLALSSQFDFNVYSWESQYVFGAEVWQKRQRKSSKKVVDANGNLVDEDSTAWARRLTEGWFSPAEQALRDERLEREGENVLKFRVDDGWNIKALWTGRVKSLLVSAGINLSPFGARLGGIRSSSNVLLDDEGRRKRWTGSVGLSIAYST